MVSRLHVFLFLALVAVLFGARAAAMREGGLIHYGSTHYAVDCSLQNVDIESMVTGCVPDTFKRILPTLLCVVVAFLEIYVAACLARPVFRRRRSLLFTTAQPMLRWGISAGVISLPPDALEEEHNTI
jgi:hypothetical protein